VIPSKWPIYQDVYYAAYADIHNQVVIRESHRIASTVRSLEFRDIRDMVEAEIRDLKNNETR